MRRPHEEDVFERLGVIPSRNLHLNHPLEATEIANATARTKDGRLDLVLEVSFGGPGVLVRSSVPLDRLENLAFEHIVAEFFKLPEEGYVEFARPKLVNDKLYYSKRRFEGSWERWVASVGGGADEKRLENDISFEYGNLSFTEEGGKLIVVREGKRVATLEPEAWERALTWGTPPIEVEDMLLVLVDALCKDGASRSFLVVFSKEGELLTTSPGYVLTPITPWERVGRAALELRTGALIPGLHDVYLVYATNGTLAFAKSDMTMLLNALA